jgi:hypothetical protein
MVLAFLVIASCSGSSSPNTPETIASTNGFSRVIDGARGGQVTWNSLNLDFPARQDVGEFRVSIEYAQQDYSEGIVPLTEPYRVKLDGTEFPDDYQYGAWFDFQTLTGTATPSHEFFDIQKSISDGATTAQTLYSWARVKDGKLECRMAGTDIVLAPIDYSGIPDLNIKPTLTDDPNLVASLSRSAQVTHFGPANNGPINGRIPIILIQGLNVSETGAISPDLEDQTGNWDDFIDILNAYPDYYKIFKFFWFIYPSMNFSAGYSTGGITLYDEIWNWAANVDHQIVERPIVLFGGSMGGLMARDYYQNFNDPEVFKLVTIATPHYGTPIANVLMDRWSKGDLMDFSFLNTPGIRGLRCKESIVYNWGGQAITCQPYNYCPIALLNNSLTSVQKSHMVMIGGSFQTPPPQSDMVLYGCYFLLTIVQEPTWLKEYRYGFHSDGIVPWTSQLMMKTGTPPANTLFPSLHADLLQNPQCLARLWWIFLDVYNTYPRV